jgi:hypothetical protein
MDNYLNYNIDINNIKDINTLKLLENLLNDYKEKSKLFKKEKLDNQIKLETIFKIIFFNLFNSFVLKDYKIYYFRSNKAIQIRKLSTYSINHKYLSRKYNLDVLNYFYNNKYINLIPHSVLNKKLSSLAINKKLINLFKELTINDICYDLDNRQYSKVDRLISKQVQIRPQKNFKLKNDDEIDKFAAFKNKKIITPKDFDRQPYINKVMKLNNISSYVLLDKKLNELKDKLNIINNFINKSNFKINNFNIHKDHLIDKLRLDNSNFQILDTNNSNIKLLPNYFFKQRRIFNNWSLIQGGRLYSTFQFISKQARNDILINDQKVSSLDLKNSHPRLVYHLSGHNISKNIDLYFECNPYNFPKDISRKLNKFILMLLLNSKRINSKRSLDNIEKEMLSYNIDYSDYFYKHIKFHDYIKYLIIQIINSHPDIQVYFKTKVGLLLQFIESEILIDSIIELIKNHNILALPVHDELIVPIEYKEITKEYIKKNYNIRVHEAIEKNLYKRFINQFNRIKKTNKKSIDISKIILKNKNIVFVPSLE